ncbi:MAG: energy-coupling factor ABC transporter ATP-binding protein [Candidatus Bathyarchaeota archaeon]|nr:energy-coupling factor ABC transporter ATP-binding protein [Candidatus Bathyarchaeota archaeon]
MIKIENLYFTYPNGKKILHGIDWEIEEGEFIAIMGENGGGKTTLVKHLNGLLKPTHGKVLIDGIDTKKSSVASLSKKVGLVFQNPEHQLFCETAEDEVLFSLKNFGFNEKIAEKRTKKILEILNLTRYYNASPFMLSGGEKKRLALASVLAWDPKYIILDEPTIGQDHDQKSKLGNFIKQLNSQGKTVIIVTHDVEFVAETKPKIVLLSRGNIIATGSCTDILTDKKILDEASLLMPQISILINMLPNLRVEQKIVDVFAAKKILEKFLR